MTVNLLLAGGIRTARREAVEAAMAQQTGQTVQEIREEEAVQIPMSRYGDIHEFGAVGAFLCGDLATYVTGSVVRCDGGLVRSL